jgi:hypothetical protein
MSKTGVIIDLNEVLRWRDYKLYHSTGKEIKEYPHDYWVCDPDTLVPLFKYEGDVN